MAEMFLDQDDLEILTGRRARPSQCRWLDQQGIPYLISATGKVQVLKELVENRLGMKSKGGIPEAEPRWDIFVQAS